MWSPMFARGRHLYCGTLLWESLGPLEDSCVLKLLAHMKDLVTACEAVICLPAQGPLVSSLPWYS